MEDIKSIIKVMNKDKTGKYHKNIIKFLKSNSTFYHVYAVMKDGNKVIDWNNLRERSIVLGSTIQDDALEIKGMAFDWGCVTGKGLNSIIVGREINTCFSYCAFGKWNVKRDFVDITEEFWARYLRVGRCLLGGHSSYIYDKEVYGENEQFTLNSDGTRVCNYCGRRDYKVTHIMSETKWVTQDDCIDNISKG